MEIRRLRYLVAVAEELSFTRAAARLRTGQPSLSQQIRRLAKAVGVRLPGEAPKSWPVSTRAAMLPPA